MEIEQELTPEQKLKGILLFKFLKTGSIPKRKGLFRALFYLAGEHYAYKQITMTSSSVTLKRPSINRTIQLKISTKLNIEKIYEIFKKYLVEFESKLEEKNSTISYLTIYYSSEHIQWALIDEELRINHKDNINEESGFPKIINYEKK